MRKELDINGNIHIANPLIHALMWISIVHQNFQKLNNTTNLKRCIHNWSVANWICKKNKIK